MNLRVKLFTPEFRNRLDAIIPFAPLGQEVIRLVVDKFVMQLDASSLQCTFGPATLSLN